MLSLGYGRRQDRGFSLTETLVVVVILALTASLAAPSFSTTLANYRIRTAAEGILSGLKLARTEAIRLNSNVAFNLASGAGWTVAAVSPSQTLQARPGNETGGNLQITSLNNQTGLTFQSTGRIQNYNAASTLTRVTVTAAALGADTLRIDVFAGGDIRMCNPAITTANDPRLC